MIIETYSDKYSDDVSRLVELFYGEAISEYNGAFSREGMRSTIESLKAHHSQYCFLMIIDGKAEGIFAGLGMTPMGSDRLMFQELIWYVNPEYRSRGIKLYHEAERRLQSYGISAIIMAVMENSKTDKIKDFYTRLGYKQFEVHYIKDI